MVFRLGYFNHSFRSAKFQAFDVFNHVPLAVPSASNARCIDCSGNAGLITSVDSAVSRTSLPYMHALQFGGFALSVCATGTDELLAAE